MADFINDKTNWILIGTFLASLGWYFGYSFRESHGNHFAYPQMDSAREELKEWAHNKNKM
jgi:hypothetical protein